MIWLFSGRMKRNCNSSFALIGRGSKDLPYDSPEDIVEWQTSQEVPGSNYKANDRSVVCCWQTPNGVDSRN
jgi:hypothetical protein